MPCDSSHYEPTDVERELSRVVQITDELSGVRTRPDPSAWGGFDKRVYGNPRSSRKALDTLTASLCSALKMLSAEKIKTYSLELQLWWRDHQEADARKAAHQ